MIFVVALFCVKIVQVTPDENNVEQLIPTVFIPATSGPVDQTMRKWIPQCEFVPDVFDLSILYY